MSARKQLQQRLDLIDSAVVLASLVGYELDDLTAEKLTDEQLSAFNNWASSTHLRASDNPVRVPPRPAWLPSPWAGADDDWGAGPTTITADDVAKAAGVSA